MLIISYSYKIMIFYYLISTSGTQIALLTFNKFMFYIISFFTLHTQLINVILLFHNTDNVKITLYYILAYTMIYDKLLCI